MTKGRPSQLIMKFIIPLIIGNIFQQFYSMADTIIVGRFVGVKALAAVGSTGTIMFLLLGFLQGLTTGFTVLTSQRFGAQDIAGVKKSVGNGVILSFIVTIIGTFVSMRFMDGLLHLMNTPSDIYDDARTYILIICAGFCFNILYNMSSSVLRAVGNSRAPLYFLVISAVINIILDLVFIINFHMGVSGAAWATVIAQGISGILCIIYIWKKVPILNIGREDLRLDSAVVKNQLSIGIPMALQFSITAIGTIMVQSVLNMLGSTAVAAYTAACKVEQFVTQPFGAMGMTMATYAGQNRGINDVSRIKKGVRAANIMSGVYAVIVAALIISAVEPLVSLFVTGDVSEITGYARTYITICGCCFIPLGMIFIYRNALQGSGYAFFPMTGGIVELLCRGIVAFIAAQQKSFAGVCLGNASAWVITGIYLMIGYFIIVRKMSKTTENKI